MNKRMLTGVYVNPTEKIVEERTIEDSLDNLYALLDCDLIDITERNVKSGQTKIPVSIICDDEGLLKADPTISAFDSAGHPALVGNLFIVAAGADDDGNNLSLDKQGIAGVIDSARPYFNRKTGKTYEAIVGVDWAF